MPDNRHPECNVKSLGRINNYSDDIEFAAQIDGNNVYTLKLKNLAAHGGTCDASTNNIAPGPFGNNVIVSGNAMVHGWDWLGQPMTEKVAAGAGVKAFKKIKEITDSATATWGDEYGIPFAMASEADGDAVGTAAVITDPATNVTGDPRGTLDFAVEPDGATDKEVTYTIDTSVPLYGVQHFADFSDDEYA